MNWAAYLILNYDHDMLCVVFVYYCHALRDFFVVLLLCRLFLFNVVYLSSKSDWEQLNFPEYVQSHIFLQRSYVTLVTGKIHYLRIKCPRNCVSCNWERERYTFCSYRGATRHVHRRLHDEFNSLIEVSRVLRYFRNIFQRPSDMSCPIWPSCYSDYFRVRWLKFPLFWMSLTTNRPFRFEILV